MQIILEGVDKQGKTSLANYLSKKFGFPILKYSQPKEDPYVEYMKLLVNQKQDVILDRFHLGELAYGPVKRGKSELLGWKIRNIEMLLNMRDSFNIYCWTDSATTKKKFTEDREDYAKFEDIRPLALNFEKAIKTSLNHWNRFDYRTDPKYVKISEKIKVWQKRQNENKNILQKMIDMRAIGNFYAKTLILGEVSNVELEQEKYKLINVPFANGPSADILYSALNKAKIPTTNYVLSNIRKAHLPGKPLLLDEIELPNIKNIVCLGNQSYELTSDYCEAYQIRLPIIKVPHPAFVARGGTTVEQYASILKKNI